MNSGRGRGAGKAFDCPGIVILMLPDDDVAYYALGFARGCAVNRIDDIRSAYAQEG